ncbi:hypothetical protein HPB52_021268 [Rhipicephalus sanguineus]|uniref:Uncharacterized protein n=1 Tax=Rhipicephalus sanguineus TaxID=34632 RepID=A0A9D4Q377_RHISA|nr:hypothetical protein HPB52_021268 [Rhipicephalus sanguineus]
MMDPTRHSTSSCPNHDTNSQPDDNQFNSRLPADPSDLDKLTSASDEDDRGTNQVPQESEGPTEDQDPNWKLALSRRFRQKQNRRERERAAKQQQDGQAAAPNATRNISTGHHSVNPSAAVAVASPTATVSTVDTLTLGGKNYEFNAYVAAPEGTLCGVIHNIDPGTPPEELIANLQVRTQGVKVHSARMLGDTYTAVITFDGTMITRYVLYYKGEVACHPYKATRQVCKVCLQQGHRSDLCPNPTAPVCRKCGLLSPPTDHPCAPQCQICREGHLTGAKECRQQLKTIWQHPPPHQTKAPATYSERGSKPQRRP